MSDNIIQNVSIQGEGNIVVGKGDVVVNPIPPAEARLRHDLGILLKNVENTWIKGVLEKSVHEAALLDLGMELREKAVDNPWRMVMESPDQHQEELPQGRKIKDIFDEANRLLLILGEPGSGKTTTLLQLARDLIAEVDDTFTQPIPVILNVSTWTNIKLPLDEWLIGELNSKYRLPKKDGKKWLTDRRILPLLDGLDEVKVENRAACVESINKLVDDYGLHGLVVCSRIKDYTNLDVRLVFYRAIYLQPLTPEQIDKYLDQAGDKLADLRETLQADGALQELAQSPLILNIMSLAYQNTSSKSLRNPPLNTNEVRIKHLFDTYIDRMFNRKGGKQEFEPEQTKQRLSWLAKNMQQHNQDVFLIESMQPSWSHTRHWRIVYILVSRMLGGLIFGVIFGLLIGLYAWLPDRLIGELYLLRLGLIFGLFVGLIFMLPSSIIDILRLEWLDKWRDRKGISNFWWLFINLSSIGIIVFLMVVLYSFLLVRLFTENGVEGVLSFISLLLFFGLISVLFFGIRGSQKSLINDIQTVEALHWYWGKALKGGLNGGISAWLCVVLIYMFLGLLFGWGGGVKSDGLLLWLIGVLGSMLYMVFIGGISWGLILGLFFGLISAVFSGLSPVIIETKTTPNQGIRLSAKNAIFGGLMVGLFFGLSFWLLGEVPPIAKMGIFDGQYGVFFSIVGVLWYGGFDIIQHYTLRLIFIIQGHTPSDYARFLDQAVDRIFLQKVGGGYRFIHRMLLEHFANMQEAK